MDATTFEKTLNSLLRRVPFQPFTVLLVNGERLNVDSPQLLLFRDGVAIFAAQGEAPCIFDPGAVTRFVADVDVPG